MSWNHGYYTDSVYTSSFFRELSPAWIDYAALLQGYRVSRRSGRCFRYLELGCGTGFGLCLLASMYPEASFVGVDFHPDHIGRALRLKRILGISNVDFLDIDLVGLSQDASALTGPGGDFLYDYIVSHGVLSWVSRDVQDALLCVAERHLSHGGVFYCSYNTNPGWLSAGIFREIAELERNHNKTADPYSLYVESARLLGELIGTKEAPTPLGVSHPGLFGLVEAMPTQDRSYLVQEYAVDAWQPMWCSDVHRRCKDVRLTFIGTATLSEIGHYFLPESIRRSLVEHSAPHRRSTLEDVVTNKSFRRDLFVKGGHQLLPHEAKEVIGSIRLQSFDLAPNCRYEFQTSFGLVQADSEAYQALEAAVDTLSPCISDLCLSLDRPLGEVLPMVSLLVHAGRLSVQRDDLSDDWRDINSLTTLKLVDLIAGGQPFSQVPVMASGMAINLSAVEAMICKGLSSGLSGDLLASLALSGLQEIGHVVLAPDGKPCSSDENALQLVRAISSNVVESRLPLFSRLGVL